MQETSLSDRSDVVCSIVKDGYLVVLLPQSVTHPLNRLGWHSIDNKKLQKNLETWHLLVFVGVY